MNDGLADRSHQVQDYLQRTQWLGEELGRSIVAIARNQIAVFEESLTAQHLLIARLAASTKAISELRQQEIVSTGGRKQLESEIHAASVQLQARSKEYAALLRYSTRSARQMSTLLGALNGNLGTDSGSVSRRETWSCEA